MNINRAISRIFRQKPVRISCEPLSDDSGVSNRIASPRAGILSCRAELPDGSVREFIGKRKTMRIIANGMKLLSGGDPVLFCELALEHTALGYNGSSVREAVLYRGFAPELSPYLPEFIGAYTELFTRSCFVAMERLTQTPPQISQLHRLVDIITEFHARYYNDLAAAKRLKLNRYTSFNYRAIRRALQRMHRRLQEENSRIFGVDKLAVIDSFIDDIHNEFSAVSFHRTLTHNDLSVRNISADDDDIRIYDWELAAYQNPEHDIIELLVSVLHNITDEVALLALSRHRALLTERTGATLSDEQYRRILRFNILELCVNKLCILRIAGKHLGLDYTEQLAVNASRMMDILEITQKRDVYGTGT